MTTYIKEMLLLCLLLGATLFAGCSDDKDEALSLPEGQGEVTFKFVRNHVYAVSTLEEMARLKVTLIKDGKTLVLPTIDLTGNEDSLSTPAVRMENGTYQVVKYLAYNKKGEMVQEAYLDADNTIEVTHGKMETFFFPVSIRIVYINNQLRNNLFGICHEVFGPDSTLWPKTWRVENEDLLKWENLEFEVDDYGQITFLVGIIFDEKFAGMKKLPASVSLLTTLEGIQIKDIPEFEELPDNFYKSGISSLSIFNTSFKAFPKDFEKMENLRSISILDSKLTELPVRLSKLTGLFDVDFSGNEISAFPAELATAWSKTVALRMADTKLTALPSNLFSDMKRVSIFDFSNNSGLSTLPESSGKTSRGGLILDGCSFTALPKIAGQHLLQLSMANNQLTSLSSADVNALSASLQVLHLNGNRLNSFPKMTSNSLIELKLDDCGLTTLPDLSALPALSWMLAANNQITEVKEGTFAANKTLSLLDLSGNKTLTTISANAGFNLVEQDDVHDGVVTKVAKPFYLHCVDVDDCPALQWTVPETWCCVKNIYVDNKEEFELPLRNVIVYNRNSPGVTRQACSVCGKSIYDLPQSLDEFLEGLKKKR